MGLAAMWESQIAIRNRMRESGSLTRWPTPALIGIPSVKAMIMNVTSLEVLAEWWVAQTKVPSVIPIGHLRTEARSSPFCLFTI